MTIGKEIDSLPNDLLVHIFKFLDIKDIPATARVCKNWNTQSNSSALWLHKIKYHEYSLAHVEKNMLLCVDLKDRFRLMWCDRWSVTIRFESIELSNSNRTAKNNERYEFTINNWRSFRGEYPISIGKKSWHVRIDHIERGYPEGVVAIGLVCNIPDGYISRFDVDLSGANPSISYFSGHGDYYRYGGVEPDFNYDVPKYKTGDIISVHLNLNTRTIVFEKNGVKALSFHMVSEHIFKGPWYIAATLSAQSQCSLISM
jgi:hypothetical protein